MIFKLICKVLLILLFISGIFGSRKKLDCNQIDSLINLKYTQGDYESALSIAKSNKKNENCNASYYFSLGKIFLSFNDFNNTRSLYNKALEKSSEGSEYNLINLEYSKLRFLLSEISFIQQILNNDQDKEKAINSYKSLISGNNSWDNGEPYIDANQNLSYDEGEEHTDWSFSEIGYLHLLIADIYKTSEDYNNSIFHLKEALKINPFVKSYKDKLNIISKMIAQKGNDFLRLNKFEQAIEKYKLSLSIDDSESAIHYNLGNSYFQIDNFEKAIESYKEVEKLDPLKYKASHKMGLCYKKIEEYDLAVVQFEKAIMVIEELKENFMSSYNELALTFVELDLYSDAVRTLNYIINKSPKYYKAYETLGVLCLESTDIKYKSNECALENFLKATEIKPNNHVLKFRLGQLYNIIAEEYKEQQDYNNMNKNLTEAKKYSRQCRQLKKTYGGAYFELGVAELNLCNKSSGIKALKQAAKYDRRYRSEVKRIIKKIKPFMNHCE